jgi:8-oxo-dGTP diphosphatase
MKNATVCYLKDNKKILFLYRNGGKEDIHNGLYIPPGGKTERGERGIDSIIREFKEETGLDLLNPKLKVIATFYNKGRILAGKENPEDYCVEIYTANKFSGKLKEEKAKILWVPEEKLEEIKMHEGDRKLLGLLDKKGIFEAIFQYSLERLIKFDYTRVD